MDADNAMAQAPHRQAAREALAEAGRAPFPLIHYAQVVKPLPMLLQRHGLGQLLAYLQLRGDGKPTSPYQLLARQLDRWLLTTLAVSARTALAALSARDSRFYREASEQAWLFLRALREGLEEPR
ncbi:MAG: hypothetical protein QOD01_99 [Actinomycetota bacterium]|jgi:hypothetical protein|nr:hypothetical protein [Actinomycetota bacterium]